MANVLVVAECFEGRVLPATMPAITFAQRFTASLGGSFSTLAFGDPSALTSFGAESVIVAEGVDHPVADRAAAIAARVAAGADYVVGAASAFGKDMLPRIAALLDAAMVSDVLAFSADGGEPSFKRPMYAGNIIATVQVEGPVRVLGIRPTAYGAPEVRDGHSAVKRVSATAEEGAHWVGLQAGSGARPDLGQARVVVTGGRPLLNAENFERYIGGLADVLGGAVGATRAVVDAGIAPNDLQVGQTGKIVAPDLYIAAGVSGSIQHMAGIKDSKCIVAINKDPEAPIYEFADYGLVADLYEAIPEMMAKLRS